MLNPRVLVTSLVLANLAFTIACAPAVAPASASGSAAPRRGGIFVGAILADPAPGNRATSQDSNMMFGFGAVYNSLVRLDSTKTIVPDLADSWTISPDEKSYTFALNKSAKFHDGRPVTSADVKFSILEVAAKYNSAEIPILRNIDHIDTPNDNTVVIVLKAPVAVLLLALSQQITVVLPKHIYEGTDPRTNPVNNTLIGSGPFKFKEWVRGDHITLVRNDDYFRPGLPYLDQIVSRIIPSAATMIVAFQKGDIDFMPGFAVPRDQMRDLSTIPGVQVDGRSDPPGQQVLFFNLTKKPLDDIRLRRAIAMAIDQKRIVDRAYSGFGIKVATSHIEIDQGAFHNPNVKLPAFDVAKANQALDDAGYKRGSDGVRMKLTDAYLTSREVDALTATLVKDMLADVGIQVQLTPLDTATLGKVVFTDATFDLYNQQSTGNNDPDLGKAGWYTSAGIGFQNGNSSRYRNPELDRLFADAGATTNVEKRKDAYWRAQEILAQDLPGFPILDYINVDFHRPELRGFGNTLGYPYFPVGAETMWRAK